MKVVGRIFGMGLAALVMILALSGGASAAEKGPAKQISIDNFSFEHDVTVAVGTRVTWVNHDDIPHSILCPDAKIHSHPLDTNDSFTYQFEKAGRFNYICGLHPHMHGQVVVS